MKSRRGFALFPYTTLFRSDGTLRDLLEKLHLTYCDTLGVEYMGISDKNQREWLAQRMEPIYNKPKFSVEECRFILSQLICAQGFEEYLHTKYPTGKRFSIEGAESLIPMMNVLIEDGASGAELQSIASGIGESGGGRDCAGQAISSGRYAARPRRSAADSRRCGLHGAGDRAGDTGAF